MALNHAHDFAMRDPTFITYLGHHAPSSVDPARILRQAQAIEALHTSATVGCISKCHPGTREEVTEDIVDWVVGAAGADQGSALRKTVLWFSGPAGGGKTSIMRGVVDRCAARGFLTASFFFSMRGSGVTGVRPFVATIVNQLIALDPVLKPIIYDAIQDRPTIFKQSLEFQTEGVLVEPLQSPAFQLRSSPRKIVIAIDGLDECREEQERGHLLDLLYSVVTKLPYMVVIVIASRPEFDLRRAFNDPKLNGIAQFIKLHDYNGADDIRVFVSNQLEEIRQSHPLRKSIPEGWQVEKIIQLLVDKSSGNFIIPVTAMKYIKNSRRNPVDSLNIIVGVLKNPLPTSKPFAELDALYTHILHSPDTDLPLMKRILHWMIAITRSKMGKFLELSFLDDFLELPPGTTAATLCDLHSILHIPESEDEPIKFHHKTLTDYLLDRERSLDFFESPYETHLDLARCCATHLTRWGTNPVVNDSSHIFCSARHWQDHLYFCLNKKSVSATLPKDIMDLDPRNSVMYSFIHGYSPYNFWREAKTFHAALCSKRHCVRLCQLIARVTNCKDKCEAFEKTFDPDDIKGRLNALSRFKSETGLFAPLDLDSCLVLDGENARNVPAPNDPPPPAVFGDEDDDVRPKAGPSTLPLPLDINLEADTTGGPVGGSGGLARLLVLAEIASSMEAYDIAIVPKKRPYEGVEANPKKRKKGNGN